MCGNRTHPSDGDAGRNGFEDRGGHQAPMHSRIYAGLIKRKIVQSAREVALLSTTLTGSIKAVQITDSYSVYGRKHSVQFTLPFLGEYAAKIVTFEKIRRGMSCLHGSDYLARILITLMYLTFDESSYPAN